MIRVEQPTPTSCGQAVLAMITGEYVWHVIDKVPDRKRGTLAKELAAYLRSRGREASSRLTRFSKHRPLPALAILRLKWPGERLGHWVLWSNGRLVDPAPALAAGSAITSYIEVS